MSLDKLEAIILENGRTIHLRPGTTDYAVYNEIFIEQPHVIALTASPRFIIDGGANIGISAVDFALRYPNSRIVAVEPEAQNFQMLLKNVEQFPNIFPVNAALWGSSTELTLSDPGGGAWAFRTSASTSRLQKIIQSVPSTTVDLIMAAYQVDSVDILKLDIEGAEAEVLKHSSNWIGGVGVLIVELHEGIRADCRAIFELATRNFDCEPTSGGKVICRQRHTPPLLG